MDNVIEFIRIQTPARSRANQGQDTAEVILFITPDQPGYGYTKAKIQNALGGGYASR